MSKQDEKVSQSEAEQPSIEAACSKPINVLVHFQCGETKFPKRIKTNNFDQFYDKVVSTINSKVPGFKSHCMQFKCGKEWYNFNQSTGFDALCLDEDDPDPEITIQATTVSSETKHLGNTIKLSCGNILIYAYTRAIHVTSKQQPHTL